MKPQSDDLTPGEYEALAEFRYQIRRFLDFSAQAAAKAGIEARQHQLLLALKALTLRGQGTIGDLAEFLQRRHHSVVGMIDRLEERGMVERCRNEADKRLVYVRLTASGERVLHQLSVDHRAELRSAAPALVRALNSLLRGSISGSAGGGR